jgi:protease II
MKFTYFFYIKILKIVFRQLNGHFFYKKHIEDYFFIKENKVETHFKGVL